MTLDLLVLDRLFARLDKAAGIIAAVSGGPDSIAMMQLLVRWNERQDPRTILIATVDHGLRPESADEAAFVAREANALDLPHRTLSWTGPKPMTGLQERARDARYGLLVGLAREAGASHLVTAHTLDDQAETILMRVSRGTGLTGLAGMSPESDRGGILHVRPLLGCSKAVLLEICRENAWAFLTDPSNVDERFARVRWRRIAPTLAAEGLTAERLGALARRVRQAEEALDLRAEEAFARTGPSREGGALMIDASVLAVEPFEIAMRILVKSLLNGGFVLHNSRLHRLEACTERLRLGVGEKRAVRMTIAGALLDLDPEGRLTIKPEAPRRRGR